MREHVSHTTVGCSTVEHCIVKYSIVQYSTGKHSTVQYRTAKYSMLAYLLGQDVLEDLRAEHGTILYSLSSDSWAVAFQAPRGGCRWSSGC